jgi:hypothetical protein
MNANPWERQFNLPVDIRHDSQDRLKVELDAVQVAVFFDKSGINNDHQLDYQILGRARH